MAEANSITLRVKPPGPIPHKVQAPKSGKVYTFEPDATFSGEDYPFGTGLLESYPNKLEKADKKPADLSEYKGTNGQPYDGKATQTAQKPDDSEEVKRLKLELGSARQTAQDAETKVANLEADLQRVKKDADTEIKALKAHIDTVEERAHKAEDALAAANAELEKLTGPPAGEDTNKPSGSQGKKNK